jgi:RimJ/RimL family protein N-acetyltransferase
MKSPFLIGERVYLRPLKKEDLSHIQKWVNAPEVRRLIGETRPMSDAGADEFYERVHNDQTRVWFAVALKENDLVIGEAGL